MRMHFSLHFNSLHYSDVEQVEEGKILKFEATSCKF